MENDAKSNSSDVNDDITNVIESMQSLLMDGIYLFFYKKYMIS